MSKRKYKIYKDLRSLPVDNWEGMRQDLRYLYKLPFYDQDKIEKLPFDKRLPKIAERLYKEFKEHFGQTDEHFSKKNSDLKMAILEGKAKLGDALSSTLLKLEQRRIALTVKSSGIEKSNYKNFRESVAIISKWLTFRIDTSVMGTVEYYEFVDSYKREVERVANANSSRGK